MPRLRNILIVILANKKISVHIFILPGWFVTYILSPLVCPGCTQITTVYLLIQEKPIAKFAIMQS